MARSNSSATGTSVLPKAQILRVTGKAVAEVRKTAHMLAELQHQHMSGHRKQGVADLSKVEGVPVWGSLGTEGAGMEAMEEKSRSGTRSDDRSSSMSPMSWKRYAASMSCACMHQG